MNLYIRICTFCKSLLYVYRKEAALNKAVKDYMAFINSDNFGPDNIGAELQRKIIWTAVETYGGINPWEKIYKIAKSKEGE